MDLPRTGIEYAHVTLTADVTLDGTPQVALVRTGDFPEEADWNDADWVDVETVSGDTHTRDARLLLAGPQAPSPGTATVLPDRRVYLTFVRLADTPEVVIRSTGTVTVT